ncbi:hypothetical protein [Euzebya tangerina]|uniref:hypothetical protein n=1 Tax=Euzebya tangerina TaxID=591198 RepID=UPI000E31C19C|nr:hypothetical protein [Euzebya tangerina]
MATSRHRLLVARLLVAVVVLGSACGGSRLMRGDCLTAWNESSGPTQIAGLLGGPTERAWLSYSNKYENNMRVSSCTLFAIGPDGAASGYLTEHDVAVEAAASPPTDGARAPGRAVFVTGAGHVVEPED